MILYATMKYENIVKGNFIDRPNRFIAHVKVKGQVETVHVKNTGRCKELLVPDCEVYLQHFEGTARKTAYDLIAVNKKDLLINMDSQAPNKVVQEWLEATHPFGQITYLKPEYKYGASRVDFYVEMGPRKLLLEVKGVTLEEEGIVLFPDAPTERGLKHIHELEQALEQGYEAAIVFVVQMDKAQYFTPNSRTQPAFAEALAKAQQRGVQVLAYTCQVTPDTLSIKDPLPVKL